jgi:hypothetical protein
VLYAYAFERVGVVLGDIYFVDPEPDPGQEGAEHGVRLEVRLVERRFVPGPDGHADVITVDAAEDRCQFRRFLPVGYRDTCSRRL